MAVTATITLDDLLRLLRRSAGAPGPLPEGTDPLDVGFADLGYDSLALLETATLIQQEFGIKADDAIADARTPREYLAVVHSAVSPPA
jgi:act minimal PKS acyl carrier protein